MARKQKIKLSDIDLKKIKSNISDINFYISDDEYKKMDKFSISLLNVILKRNGISLNIFHIKEYSEYQFEFEFDKDKMEKSIFRNAGNKVKRYNEMTVSQLIKKLDNKEKHQNIIAELNCPRANFYRILKVINNYPDKDELLEEYGNVNIFIFYEIFNKYQK